ncbi:MAG: CPBP family intramembrane glutamic endopeptidase [Bacteroidota bacterium]
MNYIQQAFKVQHDWWRYLLGLAISIMGVIVFSMPHALAIFYKDFKGEADMVRMDDINFIMTLFDPNTNLVFLLLTFAGGLVFLLAAVKIVNRQSFKSLTTARSKIDWKRVFTIFFFWGIFSSGMVLLDYFMFSENYVYNFQLQPFLILCVIAIIMVPLQTSFEEFLFRGYLMQGIGIIAKNKWLPLLVTSTVFGLLHISNPEVEKLGYIIMFYYIGTGFFLGIMTLMDEGLELAIGFHAANNLFTALLVTADWTAFQTYSVFKDISDPTEATFATIFVPVFVIFPILLLILGRIYKWKDWKGKLLGSVEELPKEDYKVLE